MRGDELWNQVDVDLYEVLHVTPQADDDDIQRAWHQAARHAHPDAGGDSDSFRQVHIAYLVLSDPVSRREYDRSMTHTTDPVHVITTPAEPMDLRTDSRPLDRRMLFLWALVVIAAIAISYAWPWFTIIVGVGVGGFVLTRYFRHWHRRGSIF